MCINSRLIRNKYTGQVVRVDCGKCKSCLQQKAVARANRIRLNYDNNHIPIFCTFTYDNKSIPFISRKELLEIVSQPSESGFYSIPIYRRSRLMHNGKRSILSQPIQISTLDISLNTDFDFSTLLSLKGCKNAENQISVCYYPDIQNFFKRYRQILIRNYGIQFPDFSFFSCSEYGGHSQRAHFHALIFVPISKAPAYKNAIDEAWTFGNQYASKSSKDKCYQYTKRDAASYVSSYINSGNALSPILAKSVVKQKHSYSRGFGACCGQFTLDKILQKIDKGDLSYSKQIIIDESPVVVDYPIPKYVITRIFPPFKGYSRFATSQLFKLLLNVGRQLSGDKIASYFPVTREFSEFEYTKDDYLKFLVQQKNAILRFVNLGYSYFDYAFYYSRVWSVYHSTNLRYTYQDVYCKDDWLSFYENLSDYCDVDLPLSLQQLGFARASFEFNPNSVKYRVKKTNNLTLLYDKLCKQRDVTNFAMSEQAVFV